MKMDVISIRINSAKRQLRHLRRILDVGPVDTAKAMWDTFSQANRRTLDVAESKLRSLKRRVLG